MNVSSIPFLTEISDKSAESIRGGYTVRNFRADGTLISEVTVGRVGQAVSGTIAAGTDTVELESAHVDGTFLVTIPQLGRTNAFLQAEGENSVILGQRELAGTIGTGVEVIITDIGNPSSLDAPMNGVMEPGASGDPSAPNGLPSSSLAFFPSS